MNTESSSYIVDTWPGAAQREFSALFYTLRVLTAPIDALQRGLTQQNVLTLGDIVSDSAYKLVARRYNLPSSPSAETR